MMRNLAVFREALARGFLIACDHDLKVRAAEREVDEALLHGREPSRKPMRECLEVWTELARDISKPLVAFVGKRFTLNSDWTWHDEPLGSSMRAIFEQAGIGERFRSSDAPLAPAPVMELRWSDEHGALEVVTAANGHEVVERITHQDAIDLRVKLDELIGRYGRLQ